MPQDSYNKLLYKELLDMTMRLLQKRASLPRTQSEELQAFESELECFRVEVCVRICIDQAGLK